MSGKASRTRILVLGGTGMLGHKLNQVLSRNPDLDVHSSVRGLTAGSVSPGVRYHEGVDVLGGAHVVATLLETVRPDVVVNAVGAIKQRNLAADVDGTFYLNGTLPHLLALLNPVPDARVIHVSTDCVFKGDIGAYREDMAPDATDLYGRSKAVGELEYGRHLTLRTSIIGFELSGYLGLLGWFFSLPRGSVVDGYTRAIYSGLPTVTLARVIEDMITSAAGLTGLYHVASEPISKFDLLSRVNAAFDRGVTLVPGNAMEMDRSLDDTRFRLATGTRRPGWDELLVELQADYATFSYDHQSGPRRGDPVAVAVPTAPTQDST
ncbi:SDR family oxidoreductase [soil metagenome]